MTADDAVRGVAEDDVIFYNHFWPIFFASFTTKFG